MYNIKKRRKTAYIQLVILAVAALAFLTMRSLPRPFLNTQKIKVAYVSRVVDGDTLKLSDGERVRLIGIDTPELHYSNKLLRDSKRTHRDIETIQEMGKRAAMFTKGLCDKKKVRLELDVEKRDKYGRCLAYVYLEDGTFVNAKIMEEGYAQVMTIPPNVKYADYFLKLEKEARANHRGLWASTDSL